MTDFVVLNVAISLVFIYFLLSVFVSGLTELYATIVHRKAKLLRKSLETALHDPENRNWVQDLYEYPQIKALQSNVAFGFPNFVKKWIQKWYRLPSYIPFNLFSRALIDVISYKDCQNEAAGSILASSKLTSDSDTYTEFKNELGKLKEGSFKKFMYSITDEAQDLKSLKVALENWFMLYSGQISEHYKMTIRKILFWIALCLSLVFNIDTIYMVKHLWQDTATTELLLMQATQASDMLEKYQAPVQDEPDSTGLLANVKSQIAQSRELYEEMAPLPMGWQKALKQNDEKVSASLIWGELTKPLRWLGWIISALAMSQGAPFWFDLLNNLINFRKRLKVEETTTTATQN